MTPPSTPLLEIEGTVYYYGDETSDYERVRCDRVFPVISKSRAAAAPALIAEVASVQDIQTCIQYATKRGFQLTVRSGGHNWFACSVQHERTMLIDMKRFDAIDLTNVDDKTAKVGPCVLGQRLNEALQEHGLCFPTGHCCGVPVGGFLLGGGQGWFQDYYGYSSDSVISLEIVTPEGILKTIQDTDDDDDDDNVWMWLARGAGSAFPGVVTSFTVKLYPLAPILRSKDFFYPLDDFDTIVQYLLAQRESKTLSHKTETAVVLATTPPPLSHLIPSPKVCILASVVMADTEEEFESQLDIVKQVPGASTPYFQGDIVSSLSFSELTQLKANLYPAGFQWNVQSMLMNQQSVVGMEWSRVSTVFEQHAPWGYSHILVVVGAPGDKLQSNSTGVAGSWPGIHFDSIACGAFDNNLDDKNDADLLQQKVLAVAEPHMLGFTILEHQCNEETFDRIFGDNSSKVRQLREQLDPKGLFWNPATTKPW